MTDALRELNKLVRLFAPAEGRNETGLTDLCLYRFTQRSIPLPGAESSYVYVILDGALRLYADNALDYTAGLYHISSADTPKSGSVCSLSKKDDFLALSVQFTPNDVFSVLTELEEPLLRAIEVGALPADTVAASDESVLENVLALLRVADDPVRREFLGRNLKRGLIFHVLCGSGGRRLLQRVVHVQQAGKIFELNNWIERNYRTDFAVSELAQRLNISVPALHQKFKSCIGMGLLQRQKQLRLLEARRLMLDEGKNVTQAAMDVGYESLSQFIREYKKTYGASPKEDMMRLKKRAT